MKKIIIVAFLAFSSFGLMNFTVNEKNDVLQLDPEADCRTNVTNYIRKLHGEGNHELQELADKEIRLLSRCFKENV